MRYRDMMVLVRAGQCIVVVPVRIDGQEHWVARHCRVGEDVRHEAAKSDTHMATILVQCCDLARRELAQAAAR